MDRPGAPIEQTAQRTYRRNTIVTATRLARVLRRGARVQATVLVTLLVILAEFAFLVAVYDRGNGVREQRVAVAVTVGRLAATTPSNAAQAARLQQQRAAAIAHELRLTARSHEIAAQARYIYVALLLIVSISWMFWFRRLVARHRALERSVSEHRAVAAGEHRLAELVRHSADLVAVLDAHSVVRYATTSAGSVLGRSSVDLTSTRLLDLVVDEDATELRQLLDSTEPGDDRSLRVRMVHADGRVLHIEGRLRNLIDDPGVDGYVLTVRDVTARVELENRLTTQASHDPLTGLANRRLLGARLDEALDGAGDCSESDVVVLFCDIDGVKDVNDSLGHAAGDRVLTTVAERLNRHRRPGDTVARFGGDEFAVLCDGIAPADAEVFAQRLIDAINLPFVLDGMTITLRASVGIAVAASGESAAEVLRNADIAMYVAKGSDTRAFAVFDAEMHEATIERVRLRAELRGALDGDQFRLHYQPTVDLTDGRVSGFEALVRWQHPQRGMVPPGEFIAVAEESGLIVALGNWVLRRACRTAISFQASGRPVRMAVNVASAQLARPGFRDVVLAALHDSGLPAHLLTLEITEGVLLHDVEAVIEQLHALRRIGVRIAIDDFGTGYSSLRYLQRLPVDIVKVDKSFVDDVTTDATSAALVEAILAMARSLDLATVAEGVELAAQANWLTRARCDYGQGYLWSRPVAYDEAVRLVARALPAA